MKWEYQVIEIDASDIAKELNEAGALGWELVQVLKGKVAYEDDYGDMREREVTEAAFKRPIPVHPLCISFTPEQLEKLEAVSKGEPTVSRNLAELGFRRDWREIWAEANTPHANQDNTDPAA